MTLQQLAELAKSATPGPWRALKSMPRVTRYKTAPYPQDETGNVEICNCGDWRDTELRPFNKDRWMADAAYIAACSPDVIIAAAEREKRMVEALKDIAALSCGVSGMTATQINEHFNEMARAALEDKP